jgi:dephospho-CoA kinase
MMKIGLTGGIASGKSTLSGWFRRHGFPVIDADQIARQVVEPGEVGLKRVTEAFGREILKNDGTLDRARLGSLIFQDQEKRNELNGLLHPLIRQRMRDQMEACESHGCPAVILDVPLLFEGPFADWTDRTIVVYVTRETELIRLMQRDHLSEGAAMTRIQAQMPLEEKKKRADAVIDNNGSVASAERQLMDLLKQWHLI